MTSTDFKSGSMAVVAMLLVAPAQATEVATLALVDRSLVAVRNDGSILVDAALVGVTAPFGRDWMLRIDEFIPADPDDTVPRATYDVSVRHARESEWRKLCAANPEGRTTAIPVPGYWNPDGSFELISAAAFSLSCTVTAPAECVRLGYAPWGYAPDGTSLQPFHRACMRMIRADYCGDGTARTAPGVEVSVFDRVGINRVAEDAAGEPEALWSPEGAVCFLRSRRPGLSSAEVRSSCPRLGPPPADGCTAASFDDLPDALLGSRS
jgi:hypothetical protein